MLEDRAHDRVYVPMARRFFEEIPRSPKWSKPMQWTLQPIGGEPELVMRDLPGPTLISTPRERRLVLEVDERGQPWRCSFVFDDVTIEDFGVAGVRYEAVNDRQSPFVWIKLAAGIDIEFRRRLL